MKTDKSNLTGVPLLPAGLGARIRILATTDLHMQLTSFDYYADRPDPAVGLTRVASLIKAAQVEADQVDAMTLLFDNGDAMQGTPLDDVIHGTGKQRHPLMRAFDHLGYDAVGLGNHDFNFGMAALDHVLRQAPCPVVSSNIRPVCDTKSTGFSPFAILERWVHADGAQWPIRIGVLSFLPPQTLVWDSHLLSGVMVAQDIVTSAQYWVPHLKQAGCDLIIALAHTGIDPADPHPMMENAVVPLAAIADIDVVVAGHTHHQFPGPSYAGLPCIDAQAGTIHGTPVVMSGSLGSHLGVVDLDLITVANGHWAIKNQKCELRPIAQHNASGGATALVPDDPALVAVLADDHTETRSLMAQPTGQSDQPLHSYFSFFAPDRALAVVAAAQAAALRPYLTDPDIASLPLLAASSPGKFGARAGPGYFTDVPAGPLTLRNVADLYIFPNQLRAVILTGQQVLDWLEMSAGLFHQIPQGSRDAPLIDPARPGHDFDVLHGLSYQIDLTAPTRFAPDGTLHDGQARRVTGVTYNDDPIQADQRFVVALNSYRVSGGGNVAALKSAQHLDIPPLLIRSALRDFLTGDLRAHPTFRPDPPWRFTSLPNTTVTVQTGPGAARYLPELSHRNVESLGIDPTGFLRLRVPLQG